MAAPLNKQPVGLLGYLGIKNGGENPIELTRDLRATWDLSPLYLVGDEIVGTVVTAGIGSGAVQFGPSAASPRRGPMYVWNYGVRMDATGAGDAVDVQLGTVHSPTGIFVPVGNKVGGADTIVAAGAQGLWLGPDDVLAVQTSAVTGTVDLVAYWRVTILPI